MTLIYWSIFEKLMKARKRIAYYALMGFLVALIYSMFTIPSMVQTNGSLTFTYPSFEKGLYPDGSKFRMENITDPNIIEKALQDTGLVGKGYTVKRIQQALVVYPDIPGSIVAAQDESWEKGQKPESFLPNKYKISLNLPLPGLSSRQKEKLLQSIMDNYLDKFQKMYVEYVPGSAEELLQPANYDYFEMEMILNHELQSLINFTNKRQQSSNGFRSPQTQLTFADLSKRAAMINEVDVNAATSLVYLYGLSKDPAKLLDKMNYMILKLEEEEQKKAEEEKVVISRLDKAKERNQDYLMEQSGTPNGQTDQQADLNNQQDLVRSLVENDIYNFLLSKTMAAGLIAREVTVEKQQMIQRKERFIFLSAKRAELSETSLLEVQKSADIAFQTVIEKYRLLYQDVVKTNSDFAKIELAHAVQIREPAVTQKWQLKMFIIAMLGAVAGFLLCVFLVLFHEIRHERKFGALQG